MIRINLLPQAKRGAAPAQSATQVWGYLYLGAAVIWGVVLAFVYFSLGSDLNQAQASNAALQTEIAKVKAQTGALEALQKQVDESKKLEAVVAGLKAGRQGPARLMLELSATLSPGRGPTVDQARLAQMRRSNPEAGFSPGWDTRRLTLRKFTADRGSACRVEGEARNNEDIAEFLRRLSLSTMFDQVTLLNTSAKSDGAALQFNLSCKVRY